MLDLATTNDDAKLVSPDERDRLVRLCARLCGSQAAEDLAQETLLEAWRSRDRLRDPLSRPQWLSGIARNVCRRWYRRESVRSRPPAHALMLTDVEIHFADDATLDVALERGEVADLLDRALGLLPAGARDLLVERYVDDLPVAELAARRGIAEGTAAVRLHRGKHALRRVLSADLRVEAVALGLLDQQSDDWQPTRIWCPHCGGAHLLVSRDIPAGSFAVRCPACDFRTIEQAAGYLGETTGYWRTLLRSNQEADRYYRDALATGSAFCACCGRASRLRYSIPRDINGLDRDVAGVHIRCDGCGAISLQPDLGLVLTHPIVQRFWRRHKRIRLAFRRETVSAGIDATLFRYESVAGSEGVELALASKTFEVLWVGGTGIQGVHG